MSRLQLVPPDAPQRLQLIRVLCETRVVLLDASQAIHELLAILVEFPRVILGLGGGLDHLIQDLGYPGIQGLECGQMGLDVLRGDRGLNFRLVKSRSLGVLFLKLVHYPYWTFASSTQ